MTGVCPPAINVSHASLPLHRHTDYLQGYSLCTLWPCLQSGWGSNIRSALCHWFTLQVSEVSNGRGWSGRMVCNQEGSGDAREALTVITALSTLCSLHLQLQLTACQSCANWSFLPSLLCPPPPTESNATGCNDPAFRWRSHLRVSS